MVESHIQIGDGGSSSSSTRAAADAASVGVRQRSETGHVLLRLYSLSQFLLLLSHKTTTTTIY